MANRRRTRYAQTLSAMWKNKKLENDIIETRYNFSYELTARKNQNYTELFSISID